MTIGIAGPALNDPRRRVVAGFLLASIIPGGGLILLGLLGDLLIDWMWFSSIGYSQVFWTTIAAKAAVFFAVFAATAIVLWVNARLALKKAGHRSRLSVGSDPTLTAAVAPPGP